MRRVLILVLPVLSLALAGCPSKPKDGECKSSGDCAEQAGYGKVCVEGRCQECSADGDCKEGFVCRDLACVPRPECTTAQDCGEGKTCEGEKCVDAQPAAPTSSAEDDAARAACADEAQFTLYYGFDESNLSSDAQEKLQKLSDCLKTAGAAKITIAGHADERGTTAYNVALGSRRAEAAKKYLSDLGAGTQIQTTSFGKENPVCTDSSEDCYAKNRRAEFKIER
jgi:peptidoglycan-associated lipoprotein